MKGMQAWALGFAVKLEATKAALRALDWDDAQIGSAWEHAKQIAVSTPYDAFHIFGVLTAGGPALLEKRTAATKARWGIR